MYGSYFPNFYPPYTSPAPAFNTSTGPILTLGGSYMPSTVYPLTTLPYAPSSSFSPSLVAPSEIPFALKTDIPVPFKTEVPTTTTAGGVVRPANWLPTTFDTFPPNKSSGVVTKEEDPVEHAKGPIKITYFNLKARAFFPMLVAEVGGIPYEWEKIAMEDWPTLKPSTPFGQLPILEHGHIVIAQSSAIASYLGRLAGLLGREDSDFAMSQMLVAQYEDMLTAMAKNYYSSNKEEEMEKYFAEKLPGELSKVEKLVSGGFTNERTIGELAIFCFLNIMLDMKPDCLDNFPALSAFYKHLAADEKVSSFVNGRCGQLWYKKDW